jgi:short-subunit dehydrogenase
VNTVAPIGLGRARLDRVAAGERRELVTIASGAGGLAANTAGAAAISRTSKATVNRAMRCLAPEVVGRAVGVLPLRPGRVRTAWTRRRISTRARARRRRRL